MAAFAITQDIINTCTAQHTAVYTPAGVRVTTPQTVPLGAQTLRCDDGYQFVGVPRVRCRISGSATQYTNYTLNADKTIGTFTPNEIGRASCRERVS